MSFSPRTAAVLLARDPGLGLFANDVVAKLDAFVADKDRGARDQLAHFVLRLAAEAAVQGAFRVRSAQFRHFPSMPILGADSYESTL